jgi:hypothetical protein
VEDTNRETKGKAASRFESEKGVGYPVFRGDELAKANADVNPKLPTRLDIGALFGGITSGVWFESELVQNRVV